MSSFLDYDGLCKYHSENKKYIDDKVPTKTSELTNDSGFVTENDLNSAISNHNTSTSSHNDIRTLISDLTTKLNNFLDVDDTTTDQLSEVITLINNNKGTLESLTTSKINTSDIVDNLTTANAKKVLSANVGVVIKGLIDTLQSELDSHRHKISNVDGLQATLDDKANKSHGTHVSYSTTAPVMDGTASVGTATTVSRSDHKHPTDTSRAAKTDFDSHASDTTKHITSTERTNWTAAKTHADSVHAPSDAEKNQNAFSNVKVGSTTISADTTTDTLELVGSNVTITPDATNDKVTIAVASGSTSAKGIVQLTNSTSSTSTTTAATPNSVKSAYDLANTAKTNAATAQSKADSAYSLAESKVDSLSDLGITATATELNYVDGVTSNIQTQLDGKSNSGHTHNYAGSSSAGGAATSANKINTDAGSATQPVYFKNGIPVVTTYTLGKSVPSNAVFTDTNTHYTSKNVVGATNATSNTTSALANGAVYLNSVENDAVTSSHKISGSGATTVTTDANGNIVISSTDNNTTYNQATSSALGLVKIGYTESGKNYPVELNSSGQMYVNVPWTDNNTVYTHPSYTARTGKPTTNQTPAFGGTATVSQMTSDATGHVTGATDRTITIPSTLSNGTDTAGLIKTTSTVTSNSGYTACPVISGVPYYKDTDTTYTHPTTAGNKHIPSGGSSGQVLVWSSSGTATWGNASASGTTVYYQSGEPTVTDTSVWIG